MDLLFSAELGHPGAMVTGHGENQIGRLDRLAGEQLRAMAAENQAVLQSDQISAFGDWRPIPRAGAGGRYGNLLGPAAGERLAQQCFGHGTAAGVSSADKE